MRSPTTEERYVVIDVLNAIGIDARDEYPGIVEVTLAPDVLAWTGQHDWRDPEIQMEHLPGGWGHENGDPVIALAHGDDYDPIGVARRIAHAVIDWRVDNREGFDTRVVHERKS